MRQQAGDGTPDDAAADDHDVVRRVGAAADAHRSIVAAATRCHAANRSAGLVRPDLRLDHDVRAPRLVTEVGL